MTKDEITTDQIATLYATTETLLVFKQEDLGWSSTIATPERLQLENGWSPVRFDGHFISHSFIKEALGEAPTEAQYASVARTLTSETEVIYAKLRRGEIDINNLLEYVY